MGLDALDARGQLLQVRLMRGPWNLPCVCLSVWPSGAGVGAGWDSMGDAEDREPHLVRADTLCCAPLAAAVAQSEDHHHRGPKAAPCICKVSFLHPARHAVTPGPGWQERRGRAGSHWLVCFFLAYMTSDDPCLLPSPPSLRTRRLEFSAPPSDRATKERETIPAEQPRTASRTPAGSAQPLLSSSVLASAPSGPTPSHACGDSGARPPRQPTIRAGEGPARGAQHWDGGSSSGSEL